MGAVPRLQERGNFERDKTGAGGAGPWAWRELLLLSALVFHGSWIFSKIFLLGKMSEEYILAFSPPQKTPKKQTLKF